MTARVDEKTWIAWERHIRSYQERAREREREKEGEGKGEREREDEREREREERGRRERERQEVGNRGKGGRREILDIDDLHRKGEGGREGVILGRKMR